MEFPLGLFDRNLIPAEFIITSAPSPMLCPVTGRALVAGLFGRQGDRSVPVTEGNNLRNLLRRRRDFDEYFVKLHTVIEPAPRMYIKIFRETLAYGADDNFVGGRPEACDRKRTVASALIQGEPIEGTPPP